MNVPLDVFVGRSRCPVVKVGGEFASNGNIPTRSCQARNAASYQRIENVDLNETRLGNGVVSALETVSILEDRRLEYGDWKDANQLSRTRAEPVGRNAKQQYNRHMSE